MTTMQKRAAAALAMALLVGAAAAPSLADPAPTGAMSDRSTETTSDQPNFVPSTVTLDARDVQVETGVQQIRDNATSYRAWTTPTLVRYGLNDRVELRVLSSAATHIRTLTSVDKGFSDVAIGFKGGFPTPATSPLRAAWMIDAALPTGSQAVRTPGVRPSAALTLAWQLPNHTSFGGFAGARADEDVTHQRFTNGLAGVNVTHDWNTRLKTFAELDARSITTVSRGGKQMMWNLGAGWAPLEATQLNAAVGFGLKDNDPDFSWSLGLTRRFTPHVPGALSHNSKDSKDDKSTKGDATPSASTESTDGK